MSSGGFPSRRELNCRSPNKASLEGWERLHFEAALRAHITKKTIGRLFGSSSGCSRGPQICILLSSLLQSATFAVTLPLSVCPTGISGSFFASFGLEFAAPGVAFLAYLSEAILYCGTSCRAAVIWHSRIIACHEICTWQTSANKC